MYLHSFLTSAPDKCVRSALYIQLLYARRQRPLYPMWHSDHLNVLEKRKPAPLSGTERRPSGLKAYHLVTTVRYPDGGRILPSLKRPYVSGILHSVNSRRRSFRTSYCQNLKTPHQYKFDVWLTVHRSSTWNKKPTRCHLVLYLFLLISCSL